MFMWSLLYDKIYQMLLLLFGGCIYNLDRLQWINIKYKICDVCEM